MFAIFYDLKVTYGNLELYYHEDFYKATYSSNVMKISTRLHTVPTYSLDWEIIVAHIPWISHFTIAGDFPLRFCCVPCHAKSHDNAGIWNFAISDEIFHVMDFLRMGKFSVLYHTYGFYCNPNYIYCWFCKYI